MLGAGLTIVLSAVAVRTIPDSMEAFRDGAMTIVGLQGIVFSAVAIVRGVWFVWRERNTLRQIWRDTFN